MGSTAQAQNCTARIVRKARLLDRASPSPQLRGSRPESKDAVSGNVAKVFVGGQHCQIVAEAELREQCVDRADLNPSAAALVSQLSRVHMVAPVGNEKRQRGEPLKNLRAIFGSAEPLQRLLQNQPGGNDFLGKSNAPYPPETPVVTLTR